MPSLQTNWPNMKAGLLGVNESRISAMNLMQNIQTNLVVDETGVE
jgi:hypothetical protein